MTNKDKFLKDSVDIEELAKELEQSVYKRTGSDLSKVFVDFLNKKISPLTEDEKVILSNIITDNYKYIHRNDHDDLWITEDAWVKPKKDPMLNIPYRESDNIFWFGMYRHLFKCIGKRRRI